MVDQSRAVTRPDAFSQTRIRARRSPRFADPPSLSRPLTRLRGVASGQRGGLAATDPTIYLVDAARLLGVTPGALRKALAARQPTIRGLAPRSPRNPTGKWLLSAADVDAELRRRGRPRQLAAGDADVLSAEEIRHQMLQGDYVDALKAQLAEKDARIEVLGRLVAEKDTRLAERDEQIAALRRRVRALADVD